MIAAGLDAPAPRRRPVGVVAVAIRAAVASVPPAAWQAPGYPVTIVTAAGLVSPARHRPLVRARDAIMLVLTEEGMSARMIGHHFGGRDPSTVAEGLNRTKWLMDRDADFAALVASVRAAVAALPAGAEVPAPPAAEQI